MGWLDRGSEPEIDSPAKIPKRQEKFTSYAEGLTEECVCFEFMCASVDAYLYAFTCVPVYISAYL